MATYTVSTTDELQQRTANAGAGDEIIARGGTYEMTSRWTVTSGGNDGSPLVIRAADGEVPKIDFNTSGSDSGIQFRDPYVHFIGFEVANSSWKGVNTDGNAHDVVLEDLDVHDSRLWGIMNNDGDNVVFRNCDSHHNDGSPENSDGFNMTGSASNGTIEGCRAWANGDDGYDFWVSSNHTIRDCWAWDNGRGTEGDGNGFKLGGNNEGGGHVVYNCVAFDNRYRGFDWNTTDNPVELFNCTAVDNDPNYRFRDVGHTLRNNISIGGSVALSSAVDDEYNSWNVGISDPQFKSRDPGSSDFLRLSDGSPAIDAGTDVGLPFSGSAPDLGAFESGGEPSAGGSDSDTTSSRTTLDGDVVLRAGDAVSNTETDFSQYHDGFNDGGYMQLEPDEGAFAQWEIEVPEAQTFDYEIRYANGGSIDRTANMTFAGDYIQVTFPQTGGWKSWDTVTGTVDLPNGNIDLAIETTGQDSGNIDQISLSPVQDDGTRSEPTGDTPNFGLNTPEKGTSDWHKPLNENFETIDRRVPIVDQDGAREEYTPADRALFIALNTGRVYVGDGSQWTELGSFN